MSQAKRKRSDGTGAGPSSAQPGSSGSQYKNVWKHTFIQSMMSKRFTSEKDATRMYKEIRGDNMDADFDGFLGAINANLRFMDMEVRRLIWQVSPSNPIYIGLVNKAADISAKTQGTKLSHAQLSFFRSILEYIATDNTGVGTISSIEATNLQPLPATQVDASQGSTSHATQAKRMNLGEKQSTLATLVNDGWLAVRIDGQWTHDLKEQGEGINTSHHQGGHFTIGVRTFLELRNYLTALEMPNNLRSKWDKML